MSSHEEADFISSLLKYRATLTMLGSLSDTRNNGVTLIDSEKVGKHYLSKRNQKRLLKALHILGKIRLEKQK